MGSLTGKVALVTGASRGIGADTALMLAGEGARVVCCARTEHAGQHPLEGSLDATVAAIRGTGAEAAAVRAERGWGRIVNVTSESAIGPGAGPYERTPIVGDTAYGAQKAAIERFTQGLAEEVYPQGVGVAAIAPSLIVPTPGALANGQVTGDDDPRAEDRAYMPMAIRALVTDPVEQMAGRVVYSQQLLLEKRLIETGRGLGVDPERRVTGYVSASVPRA